MVLLVFFEACILAFNHTKKNKIVVSKGLHYQALQVLKTYVKVREFEIVEVDLDGTITDLEKLEQVVDDETLCSSSSISNFYGSVEDLEKSNHLLKAKKHYLSFMLIH